MADKRYFWLKLKEDFFQDEAINWLEEQENGKEYVLFYLIRTVGTLLVPYDESTQNGTSGNATEHELVYGIII